MTDGKTVGFCDLENMVRRNEASGALHVLDDNDRIAGNMLAYMPRDETRVGVVSAAGGEAHNETDRLALKKWFLTWGRRWPSREKTSS